MSRTNSTAVSLENFRVNGNRMTVSSPSFSSFSSFSSIVSINLRMAFGIQHHSRMRIKCEQNRFFSFGLSFCNHFTDNGLVSEMNTIIGSQCHNGPIELNVWSKITNYAHSAKLKESS